MLQNIELSDNFKKSFRKLPENVRFQFAKKRTLFYENPFIRVLKTHKLKGQLKDYWSFSVTYSCRVIFKFVNNHKVIFYDIGDHQVYH